MSIELPLCPICGRASSRYDRVDIHGACEYCREPYWSDDEFRCHKCGKLNWIPDTEEEDYDGTFARSCGWCGAETEIRTEMVVKFRSPAREIPKKEE